MDGCVFPTHTCIAYLPFVKTINKLKMQIAVTVVRIYGKACGRVVRHIEERVARQVGRMSFFFWSNFRTKIDNA